MSAVAFTNPALWAVAVAGLANAVLLVMLLRSTCPCPSCTCQSKLHMNPASTLPPVECPLLIEVNGAVVEAQRDAFVATKDRELSYRLRNGHMVTGRFPWTYP